MIWSLRHPIFAAFTLLAAFITVSETEAQELSESRIVIVDFQFIQKNSSAAADIQSQIENRRKGFQEEISAQEKELRAIDQELVRQRSVLSADAFALKRREFEAKVASVQRDVQDRKRELDKAYEFGMNQVQLVINDIIAELSREKNFNIVLSRQQLIFAKKSLDISEDIVQLLNERLPNVQVP